MASLAPDGAGSSGEHTPTYRPRGLSFLHRSHNGEDNDSHDEADDGAIAGSWWGDRNKEGSGRPWHNLPKRRKTIPPDQTVAYERTKDAVAKAAVSVLGKVAVSKIPSLLTYIRDVGHEALIISGDILQVAPIIGLAEAARVLLSIWDSVEAVETNRLSCLRLTERCATILSSIRDEIGAAGVDVAETLREPLAKLTDSFRRVEHFIQKQVSRPFLKRYLKRDEDARKIMGCDASLTDSVGLFSVAIQIRMLKAVQAQGIHAPHLGGSPREVLAAVRAARAAQAAHDAALDTADLYAAMRAAMHSGNDAAMLDVLQITRGDLAEAMKTLQRALEDPRVSVGRAMVAGPDALGLSNVTTTVPTKTDAWVSVHVSPVAAWDRGQDAAFHREFLENGLDALRRISGDAATESLPAWTITRWEVDREGRIGVGFFSDVYKGTWGGRQVAIKILAPTTPRKLFRHETAIWASLKHPHVLELLGASSAAGDPPWFFVSPYMRNGTLVTFLKSIAAGERPGVFPDPLNMMREIAVGMAYLHRKDVLHGDLKANNVLIDDDLRCVISDFGQSELRSEVFRLSHQHQPHGTQRWQAPEIMSGEQSVLTPEADVYAFAIVCIEILTNGNLPWPLLDAAAVERLVLRENRRPPIPLRPEVSLPLIALIEQCWSLDPHSRPPFESVARGLGHLESGLRGSAHIPSPLPRSMQDLMSEDEPHLSPDLAPSDLPAVPPSPRSDAMSVQLLPPPVELANIPLQRVVSAGAGSSAGSVKDDSSSEVFVSTPEGDSSMEGELEWDGYESPPPRDERIAARKNERRYRLLLQHEFNPSLNLPLWEPAPVELGAVGYLSKPSGTFVTLFNAYNPSGTGDGRAHALPSIYGFGAVREASQRQDRRTVTQTFVQIIQGLLTFKKAGDGTFSRPVTRRHSFPLRAGHKHAYLCTENTMYRYMINMVAAKAWFKANIKEIMHLYAHTHRIQREDVFLVVGTLETREWGLFVSHEHPDGQLHFNVYSDRREGQDWGSFSTDTTTAAGMAGPEADGESRGPASVHASKISRGTSQEHPDVVLLARLRFRPDVDEPTRL